LLHVRLALSGDHIPLGGFVSKMTRRKAKDPMRTIVAMSHEAPRFLRRNAGLILVLMALSLSILFIDPLREALNEDDSFSYARSVQYLLDAGEYRADSWTAANMPVQILFGAALAKIFGYSLGILRVSTLIIFGFGLAAFYRLLRDFGLGDTIAGLFTLGLLCSPPVLLFSFSFMTDVQSMSWMIIALWLYTRALRLNDMQWIFFASIASAAAIGTRQFDMALIASLCIVWALQYRTMRSLPFFGVGLLAPSLVAGWQIWFGTVHPSFTQLVRLCEESAYLRQNPIVLLGEIIWRPAAILEHAVLFLLPLMPVGLYLLWIRFRGRQCLLYASITFVGLASFCALLTTSVIDGHVERQLQLPTMPWLVAHWIHRPALLISASFVAVSGACVLGWIISIRYIENGYWRRVGAPELFVALTGILLFSLHLMFVVMNDTYVIAFLPFVLFAVALQAASLPRNWQRATVILCIASLTICSFGIRRHLIHREALFSLANGDFFAGAYYGSFDRWVAEEASRQPIEKYCRPWAMHNAYFDWVNSR
jgi:hypothetical protein